MPTGYLTRIVEFTATHSFPDLPEFHGATHDHSHRYRCAVTVKGAFDPTRGGVMGLNALDGLLRREVVDRFDGRHINKEVRFIATGEALAAYVWEQIVRELPPGVLLHRVRIEEGPHLYAEYYGEP
jgi:6-pyruvoyl-tetrahydropterin synthase